jgi:hypothetical protein
MFTLASVYRLEMKAQGFVPCRRRGDPWATTETKRKLLIHPAGEKASIHGKQSTSYKAGRV